MRLGMHGYDMEMADIGMGAIRTTFRHHDTRHGSNTFRTRLHINFNPARTQLILRVDAAILIGGTWRPGSDVEVLELVRNDLQAIVGG